nr:CmpA/NrtA family ABC transporter substrate-binding protein [Roseomonas acroporae]
MRIGFIPLTDAAPLLVAEALGLFRAHGAKVTLAAEHSWATLRDKLAFGALDGAHLLYPMPIAMALGLGGVRAGLAVVAGLGINGNTLTLSPGLAAEVLDSGLPAAVGFARAVRRRAREGLPPLRLAVVFAYSSHHYLVRYWLASAGLDPDRDVELTVVPPPLMPRRLAEGAIDGFCAGEPWGSQAVLLGAGRITLTSGEIWPNHPEKVLAVTAATARAARPAVVGATAAVIEAARWLDDPANTAAAAALLRERAFPDLPEDAVACALTGRIPLADGVRRLAYPLRFRPATLPQRAHAAWYLGRMRRWGHVPEGADEAVALAAWNGAAATPAATPPSSSRAASIWPSSIWPSSIWPSSIWNEAAALIGEPVPGATPVPVTPPPLVPVPSLPALSLPALSLPALSLPETDR